MPTDNDKAFDLIVEMLKRNSSDIHYLRDEIKKSTNEVHQLRMQINKLETHDALLFDPEEIKRIRSEAKKESAVVGTGAAGVIVAAYEFVKSYLAG